MTSLALVLFTLVVASALRLDPAGLSDFARIPLPDRKLWYRDMGGRRVPEIQDLDIFYHAIGPSIDAARQADIILLGPSFLLFAIDPEEMRQFGEKHHLRIYNMAFFGVRSGEFSREMIRRWSLHPKLWIINVDDNFDHFFSTSRKMWWFGSSGAVPIPPLNYDRFTGWRNVARRNLRWRWEDLKVTLFDGLPASDHSVYRRTEDGSVYLDNDPHYRAVDNKTIEITRNSECHTNPEIVSIGRDYLASIGGAAVLTLVPNSTWCPTQAVELGKALNEPVILPPDANYSTVDGGGHLDHVSAVSFTRSILADLEKTDVFRALVPQ